MAQLIDEHFNAGQPSPVPQGQPPVPPTQVSLEERVEKLKHICKLIDPYRPIPDELKKLLKEFGINNYYDPFAITNKLLLQLEDTIEQLEALKKLAP